MLSGLFIHRKQEDKMLRQYRCHLNNKDTDMRESEPFDLVKGKGFIKLNKKLH